MNKPDKKQLEQWYCIDKRTTVEIAARCGVSSRAVGIWLKKFGIKARNPSEAAFLHYGNDFITKDLIEKLYIRDRLSQQQISERLGVTQATVGNYMKRFGIPSIGRARPGKMNGMFGRKHSPESIQKIRDANNRQFADPKMREMFANKTADQISQGRTGKSYNKFENRVADMLDAQGQVYVRQYRLGRYSFDFYIPETNTLVEAHGTFWHADPRFYPNRDNLSKIQVHNIENDAKKSAYAIQHGYKLHIVWESDV